MNAKILRISDNVLVPAIISRGITVHLPSLTEGWQFNFRGNTRREALETYILTTDDNSDEIQGCLSFKMNHKVEPYMAYIEIAPHNKGKTRRYDDVAGCLIAYACRLSFINGKGDYKGWLAFDVLEETAADSIKLMALYSKKYGALKFGETTMVIPPNEAKKLIDQFLNR